MSKQVIAQWLSEKAVELNDPNALNDFVFGLLDDNKANIPEFKVWKKAKKAQLQASQTPEVLEALKSQHETELAKQIADLEG